MPLKDKLFRMAFRITLNQAEAEDAVQETLIRIWEHRQEWGEIESMEAYSLTVCRRIAINIAGKAGRGNVSLDDHTAQPATHSLSERMEQQERVALIKAFMDSLPEVQRSIMQLRDIEGMDYREIGNVLELTETQVKVYLHRARKQIREKIEETERYGL